MTGVDISAEMVRHAGEINADRPNCDFVVNPAPDLARFESRSFDLVYSSLVLQHVPGPQLARGYVQELVRVLGEGGLLVFQLPSSMPLVRRLQLSRRLYAAAQWLGIGERFLLRRTPLTPMRMLAIPEHEVRAVVEQAGGSVLDVDATSSRYFVASSSR